MVARSGGWQQRYSVLLSAVATHQSKQQTIQQRMEQAGAYITTAESLIFMLLGGASHPKFRDVSGLIKEHAQGDNPFNAIVANGGSAAL